MGIAHEYVNKRQRGPYTTVNMVSPVTLIIVSRRVDLELLENFAGRNAMAVVSAEARRLSGLGHYTQDDLLDTSSLFKILV